MQTEKEIDVQNESVGTERNKPMHPTQSERFRICPHHHRQHSPGAPPDGLDQEIKGARWCEASGHHCLRRERVQGTNKG